MRINKYILLLPLFAIFSFACLSSFAQTESGEPVLSHKKTGDLIGGYFKNGEWDLVISKYWSLDSASQRMNNRVYYKYLACSYAELGEYRNAANVVLMSLREYPDTARQLLKDKHCDKAELLDCLASRIESCPELYKPDEALTIIRLLFEKRQYAKALQLCENMKGVYFSNSDILYYESMCLMYMRRYDDAVASANKCSHKNSDYKLTADYLNGLVLFQQGHYNMGIKKLNEVADSIMANYSWVEELSEHYTETLSELYSKEWMIDSADFYKEEKEFRAKSLLFIASYNYLESNYTKAISCCDFAKGLFGAVGKDEANNYLIRALCHEKNGATDSAEMDFRKVLTLKSLSNRNTLTSACAYYHLDSRDSVVEILKRMQYLPDDELSPEMLLCMTELYTLIGDAANAKRCFDRCLRKDPLMTYVDPFLKSWAFGKDKIGREVKKHIEKIKSSRDKTAKKQKQELDKQYRTIQKIYVVPFQWHSNHDVCYIDCLIDNYPVKAVFDPGAAEVCIPEYLEKEMENVFKEINNLGSGVSINSAGGRTYNRRRTINSFKLKCVRLDSDGGDKAYYYELRKIPASVKADNPELLLSDVPILIGNTVWSRFDKVEIDYENSVLRLSVTEKTKVSE